MMEEQYSKEEMYDGCDGACEECGMCREQGRKGGRGMMGGRQWRGGMYHGGRYGILRWIVGIAILVFVFAAGFKLAEFREEIMGMRYGAGMLRGCNMEPGYGILRQRNDIGYDRYGIMMRAADAGVPSAAQGR